jgi:hypothetical protein
MQLGVMLLQPMTQAYYSSVHEKVATLKSGILLPVPEADSEAKYKQADHTMCCTC